MPPEGQCSGQAPHATYRPCPICGAVQAEAHVRDVHDGIWHLSAVQAVQLAKMLLAGSGLAGAEPQRPDDDGPCVE